MDGPPIRGFRGGRGGHPGGHRGRGGFDMRGRYYFKCISNLL